MNQKLQRSSYPIAHSKAATSANKPHSHIGYPCPLSMRFLRHNFEKTRKIPKRVVHFVSSKKLRKETEEDMNQTNSNAVFQGLHAPYTRFPSNSPLRMVASKHFLKKLENSLFSCTHHFLVDMINKKSF